MCFVGPPPPVRLSSRCYPGEEVTQGTGRAGDYLVHAADWSQRRTRRRRVARAEAVLPAPPGDRQSRLQRHKGQLPRDFLPVGAASLRGLQDVRVDDGGVDDVGLAGAGRGERAGAADAVRADACRADAVRVAGAVPAAERRRASRRRAWTRRGSCGRWFVAPLVRGARLERRACARVRRGHPSRRMPGRCGLDGASRAGTWGHTAVSRPAGLPTQASRSFETIPRCYQLAAP